VSSWARSVLGLQVANVVHYGQGGVALGAGHAYEIVGRRSSGGPRFGAADVSGRPTTRVISGPALVCLAAYGSLPPADCPRLAASGRPTTPRRRAKDHRPAPGR
jgi:hypothetical protein